MAKKRIIGFIQENASNESNKEKLTDTVNNKIDSFVDYMMYSKTIDLAYVFMKLFIAMLPTLFSSYYIFLLFKIMGESIILKIKH